MLLGKLDGLRRNVVPNEANRLPQFPAQFRNDPTGSTTDIYDGTRGQSISPNDRDDLLCLPGSVSLVPVRVLLEVTTVGVLLCWIQLIWDRDILREL